MKTPYSPKLGWLRLAFGASVFLTGIPVWAGVVPDRAPALWESGGPVFSRSTPPSLFFEQHTGEAGCSGEYLCRAPGYTLHFSGGSAAMSMGWSMLGGGAEVLRMVWARGDERVVPVGEAPVSVTEQYLAASFSPPRTDVPQFRRVRYADIYPGVDMVFYKRGGDIEYDLIVKPGGKPTDIAVRFEGAHDLELNEHGDLVLRFNGGEVTQSSPVIYQLTEQGQVFISGSYVLHDGYEVGYAVAQYNESLPLIIDPVLKWEAAHE